jgi:hypothetical protein
VAVAVADHPAAAVEVDDDGQRSGRARGAHDPDRDLAGRPARVLDVDVGLVDRIALHLIEGHATLHQAELEQVRRVCGRVGERLRGGLEHDWGDGQLFRDTPIVTPRGAVVVVARGTLSPAALGVAARVGTSPPAV